MLSVTNLSVSFDDNHVLDGFNLDLQSGDIFALLGDSGSGKSSALRFIAGLESASNGRVALDGNNLSLDGNHSVKPELREIGMVFQDYALFPHMTVFQNISFGIDYLSKKEKIERVQTLLELISLEGIEKKYPHQLSGGEQQMMVIGRALMAKPKLLLLDEPSLGIAPKLVQDIARSIVAINRDEGVSVLLVEQNSRMALSISHRAYAMATGNIVIEGNSKELLHDDRIKAAYLGGEV